MTRQVHQMLPALAYGDAVGNQALEFKRTLRAAGYQSEIFVEHWDPRLANECRPYQDYRRVSHADNLLLLHYSIGGAVNTFVRDLPDRVILYYHNITPAKFFYQINGQLACLLEDARRDLRAFIGRVPALAASPFNEQELAGLGFQVLGVVPYIFTFDQLDAGLSSTGAAKLKRQFARADCKIWLYVGRLAPNKCVQDVIKAFAYYHTWIETHSRLLLVGSGEGMDAYVAELYRWVTRLNLDGAVVFAGHYGAADGLAAFYQMADVYISMSEHEGFCIPLMEAMHYALPVLAYDATGVPFTLGDAGILIRQKEFSLIAEMAHEVIDNLDLRARIQTKQRERLRAFQADRVRRDFCERVAALLPS